MALSERLRRACLALPAKPRHEVASRIGGRAASIPSSIEVGLRRSIAKALLATSVCLLSAPGAVAAQTDCIGESEDGRAVCSVPDVGKWTFGLCDEAAPYANRDAAWCAAYGGTYGGIYNGCSDTTVVASEDNLYGIAQAFAQKLWNSSCTGSDSRWGISVSSNQCWSGSTTTQNNIVTGQFRRFQFTCSNGAGETITARQDRSLPCPPGTTERTLNGQQVCVHPIPPDCNCGKGNPIIAETGQKIQREEDGAFEGWSLSRRYMSFGSIYARGEALATQSLGVRWRDSFDFRMQPLSGTSVVAALSFPNGSIQYFRADGSAVLGTETSSYRLGGTAAAYEVIGDGLLLRFDGNGRLVTVSTAGGQTYTLTYSDGTTSGPNGQVAKDSNGTQWGAAVPPNQLIKVQSSTGRVLRYERDVAGKVTQMQIGTGDPTRYFYTPDDLIAKVVYPGGQTRIYHYNESTLTSGANLPYALTGISDLDSNGVAVRYASFSYDGSGRAVSTEHAGGVDRHELQFNPSTLQTVITDPLGAQRTEAYVSVLGVRKLVSASQPAGSGSAAANKTVSYDASGNRSSVDDQDGIRTCMTYEATRNLEAVRVEGLPNTQACMSVTAAGAVLPAGSRKVSTQWHPTWAMPVKVAEPGRLTTLVYNGQPDPFNGNATANCAPSGAALPNGHALVVLCRRVEKATTDPNGDQGFTASQRPGSVAREDKWTYNARGQVLTHDGPRTDVSDVTTFAYYADTTADHTVGDLQSVTNAAGHSTQYTVYDAEGRVKRSVSPGGIVSQIGYTPRGWVNSLAVAAGSTLPQTTTYTYEPDGRPATASLPDGTTLTYGYDTARRLMQITDSIGNKVSYTLDAAGNRISEQYTDPNGTLAREIKRAYDALGRLMTVTGAMQ